VKRGTTNSWGRKKAAKDNGRLNSSSDFEFILCIAAFSSFIESYFLFYENIDGDNFHIYVFRLLHKNGHLVFKEKKIK
jgi:hypothetical protein